MVVDYRVVDCERAIASLRDQVERLKEDKEALWKRIVDLESDVLRLRQGQRW